jgi:anti-anti-sigma regulatory factor
MARPWSLSLSTRPDHDLLVIGLHVGRRDLQEELSQELRALMQSAVQITGTTYVLFDATEVDFFTNSLFGPMIHVLKLVVRERRGAVLVCGLNETARDYFQIVKLDRIFRLCADEPAALLQVEAYRSGREEPWRWPPRTTS